MKKNSILLVLLILLTACGASPTELAFQTQEAATASVASWTKTPSLTQTATAMPTSTATAMPTSTVTITPSPTPFAGGGQIAFWASNGSGEIKLYLANTDGNEQRVIFDPQEYGLPANGGQWLGKSGMSWSPNGQFLTFFYHDFMEQKSYVYLYDDSSSSIELIESTEGLLLFVDSYWFENEHTVFINYPGLLKVVKIQDKIEFISYPDYEGWPLGINKNGEIIFLSENVLSTVNSFEETVIDAEIDNETLLALNGRSDWVGTEIMGQFLYFVSEFNQDNLSNTYSLYKYDLAYNTLEKLISYPGHTIWQLSFSSDGKLAWLLHCEILPNGIGNCEVSILDMNSLEPIYEFTEALENFYNPTWSPDNNYLLFGEWDTKTIRRLDIATGEIIMIIDGFEYVDFPSWGP